MIDENKNNSNNTRDNDKSAKTNEIEEKLDNVSYKTVKESKKEANQIGDSDLE